MSSVQVVQLALLLSAPLVLLVIGAWWAIRRARAAGGVQGAPPEKKRDSADR